MDKLRILFMGTPDFAAGMLDALLAAGYLIVGVVTQPDRPTGRKKVLTPPPVKVLAEEHGLFVMQPEKVRDPETLARCAELLPDVIITAAYGQLLPEKLLQLPKLGAFNVHASLLPKYRGGAPIQWAILNGERETGITLMTMVKKMDAGPIWAQKKVVISPNATYGQLHDDLVEAGASLLIETLPQLVAGVLSSVQQVEAQATFAPTLTRKDELLDFTQDAGAVYNRIRALCPKPGAFTWIGDKQVKIWYATPDYGWRGNKVPGQVVEVTPDGIKVACGDGALILTRLQWEGKTAQNGADFARGMKHLDMVRCTPERASCI